jgi:hypothetical protein
MCLQLGASLIVYQRLQSRSPHLGWYPKQLKRGPKPSRVERLPAHPISE